MNGDAQALVSVIVPTYNAEKFLDQCLDSICAQTHRNLEVLCINDGSIDSSLSIMKAHAEKDARIRIIDKENGGYGAGCNRGLAEAKGEWISIIEPDDWIDSGMYADMLAFASRFEERIDIIKTPWWDIRCWDDPATMKAYPCLLEGHVRQSKRPCTLAEQPELLEFHPAIWSAIYRRGFLDDHGIRFPEYPGAGWADNPFLIETLCQANTILYLDKRYYRYRADLPGSTLNHATEDAVRRPFDRWVSMLDIMKRLGIDDPRILESHYLRGFTYVEGAIYDDGANNPIVQEGARTVFGLMDEDIVLASAKISGKRKREYCRMLGKQPSLHVNPGRIAYVLRDAGSYVHVYGLTGLAVRLIERFFGRKQSAAT